MRSIAAQTVVLRDGDVVEAGATSEVLDRPEAEYTRRLLEDLPRLRTAGIDSGVADDLEQA